MYIGKETVTLIDGGSYMDSAEVFAMIRGSAHTVFMCIVCTLYSYSIPRLNCSGHLHMTMLGAMQV